MGLESPFAVEHPRHSRSSPTSVVPCCFAVVLSSTSWEWPCAQWKSLMSTGVLGAFALPGAIAAQACSVCVRKPFWPYRLPHRGSTPTPPPSLQLQLVFVEGFGFEPVVEEGSERY